MKNQLIRKFDRSGSFFPTFFSNYLNDDLFSFVEGNLPATNITENDKSFNIELSIPGFKKEDVRIEIEKGVLKISAQSEIQSEEKDENEKVLRQEFRASSFSRSFAIPENVDAESIEASQKDGVLQITLPKLNKALEDKVKKIEIK